jgi:hypothetical protein
MGPFAKRPSEGFEEWRGLVRLPRCIQFVLNSGLYLSLFNISLLHFELATTQTQRQLISIAYNQKSIKKQKGKTCQTDLP